MKRSFILVCVSLTLFAMGCGKMKPLTAEQKAMVGDVGDSTQRTQNAVPKEGGHGREIRLLDFVPSPSPRPTHAPRPLDPTEQKMQDRLKKHQAKQECAIAATVPVMSGTSTSGTLPENLYDISVSGPNCPIDMGMKMTQKGLNPGSTSGTLGMEFKYQVKDSSFSQLNDVDAFEFRGSLKMSGGSNSGKVELNGSGFIHSQKLGKINVSTEGKLEGNMSGGTSGQTMDAKGEIKVRFEFPNFDAEIRMEMDNEKTKYFLNDQETTEDELRKLFDL